MKVTAEGYSSTFSVPNRFSEDVYVPLTDRDATEPIPPNRTAVVRYWTWTSNWDITTELVHPWDCAQDKRDTGAGHAMISAMPLSRWMTAAQHGLSVHAKAESSVAIH